MGGWLRPPSKARAKLESGRSIQQNWDAFCPGHGASAQASGDGRLRVQAQLLWASAAALGSGFLAAALASQLLGRG